MKANEVKKYIPYPHVKKEQGRQQKPVDNKAKDTLEHRGTQDSCIIQNLVTPGLSIFCSRCKQEESLLTLLMAVSVASGRDFLGKKTAKGDVLYCVCEEASEIIRQNFEVILGYNDAPEGLSFTNYPGLDDSFISLLDRYLEFNSETKLVIINFPKTIRKSGKNQADSEDNSIIMNQLNELAVKHEIAVVASIHARKNRGGNSNANWGCIANKGSGYLGAANTIMFLSKKRGMLSYSLRVMPKDFLETVFEIYFSEEDHTWMSVQQENLMLPII